MRKIWDLIYSKDNPEKKLIYKEESGVSTIVLHEASTETIRKEKFIRFSKEFFKSKREYYDLMGRSFPFFELVFKKPFFQLFNRRGLIFEVLPYKPGRSYILACIFNSKVSLDMQVNKISKILSKSEKMYISGGDLIIEAYKNRHRYIWKPMRESGLLKRYLGLKGNVIIKSL